VRAEFQAQGGYFLSQAEADAVAAKLVTPQRLPNPSLVGKSAAIIAETCDVTVPPGTRVLIAELEGVGRDYPLSIEKLCPVLSFYVVADWRAGCERCKEILRYGGMGHTMSIHSRNEQVILEFGLKKPAFRIVVNTPTTHGSIGLTTGLDPAMTLGCGGYGGNITSDNISPRHLLNIKRLAYEISPAVASADRSVAVSGSAHSLPDRIDAFLGARGFRSQPDAPPPAAPAPPSPEPLGTIAPMLPATPASDRAVAPLDFVCEDDVRRAIAGGKKLILSERAIVTPAARDLGEEHRVFAVAPWQG
jgi:acetaldehyde dehydrogenase (acetylating)